MSNLMSLPDEVLKLLMHHLSTYVRLNSCLVNKRLHAAAVAATDDLHLLGIRHGESSLQWLSHYGQYVTRLALGCFQKPLQQLPCPALLELDLGRSFEHCSVQLGPADGYSGVVQSCPKLTRLELHCCDILDLRDAPAGAALDSLSNLVHLQHLKVQPYKSETGAYAVGGLSAATLPRLAHLTFLEVCKLSTENFAQLGALTELQELCLPIHMTAKADQVVPSMPGLVLPASLTKLVLECDVEAGSLSMVPAGLRVLEVSTVVGPVEGPGSLFAYIAELQQLMKLEVWPFDGAWPPAGPAYSSLTASSSLGSLLMWHSNCPAGVWPHVFLLHASCCSSHA